MILIWIATAVAEGLSSKRACAVLGLTPRTLQRWQRPARPQMTPPVQRPRPVNALTRPEAAAVVSIIRSTAHADQSCRELAISLAQGIPAISVSPVSIWRYQRALRCNGPRGRQGRARHLGAPDTDWVNRPNQLWDGDGRPFGRLVNVSSDTTHHQGSVSSPWRFKAPSDLGSVSIQGTRASRAGKTDSQQANAQERMGRG